MWDIHKGNCVRLFTGHARGITCLTISSNGRLLASGGNFMFFNNIIFIFLDVSGATKIWDIAEGKLLKSFPPESGSTSKSASVYALSFCQDGKILASCYSDNTLKLWDVQKTAPAFQSGHFEEPMSIYSTKQTPLVTARFTARNVLSVIGTYLTE